MRELKFRVWDKVNKTYKQDTYHSCHDANGVHDISAGRDYVLQQFTGLQDSEGKDIYEGDVLGYGDNSDLDIVVYHKSMFVTCAPGRTPVDGYSYQIDRWVDTRTIIGNINENPELLKI